MAVREPKYCGVCARHNCGKPGGYVIVVHVWPREMHQLFRSRVNSTKLYPDIEACDEHKLSLQEPGLHFLMHNWQNVVDLFNSLGRGTPDIKDTLIDLMKADEALKMWRDATVDSPADGVATVIERKPELILPPSAQTALRAACSTSASKM